MSSEEKSEGTQAAGGGLVAEVKALVEQYVEPKLNAPPTDPHEVGVLTIGERQKVVSLLAHIDAVRERPVHVKGVSTHLTRASLELYTKRAIGQEIAPRDAVVAWAQLSPPSITVVFDSDSMEGNGWRQHRASYAFPISPEWERWAKAFDRALSTSDLAELLEDRLGDVATREAVQAANIELPAGMRQAQPAELLTLAEGLQLNIGRQIREVRRRDNGTADLAFAEDHDARDASGKPITIPNGFVLALAPFVDGQPFAVPVRLRYTHRGGQIQWTLSAHNADLALRRCVQSEVAAFSDATNVFVMWGVPEAPATVR